MATIDEFINAEVPAEAAPSAKTAGTSTTIDPLTEFVAGDVDPNAKLSLSVGEGLKRDSIRSSRVLNMQMKTGLPEDLIERNLESIEVEAQKSEFNPQVFNDTSEIVSRWYAENPNHPAVAYKDIAKLSYIERLFKNVSSRKERGELKREMADLGAKSFAETITKEERQRLTDIKNTLSKDQNFGIEGFWETLPGDFADQYPNYRDVFISSAKGGAIGAAGGAALGAVATLATGGAAAPLIPGLAMQLGSIGMMAGGAYEAARTEGAQAFVEYEDMVDANGNKIDRNVAKGAAIAVGLVNGSLESLSMGGIFKTIPGVKQLQSKLGKDAVKRALTTPGVRSAIGGYFKTIAESAGTEGVTEFLQEMTTSVAGDISAMSQDGRLEKMSTGEILSELFSEEKMSRFKEAAVMGAKVGGGLTTITQTMQAKIDISEAKKAAKARDVILNLGEGIKDTELMGKVPGKMEEVIGRTVEGTPVENINIPVTEWQTYWQSKQVDPREVFKEVVGETESYEHALRSGEDISIPTKRYAVTIAPTEHNEVFADHIRFDENELTAFEVKNILKRAEESAKVEEQTGPSEITVSGEEIENNISSQLKEQGFDENSSNYYAQLHRSFFETMAKKSGQAPAALFQRYNLKVTGDNLGATRDQKSGTKYFQEGKEETKLSPLGFYSQLETSVTEMDFKSIPPSDLKNRISKIPGIKKEELEWTGINEFLDAQEGKVTKEQVQEFIKSNGVVVDQLVQSEDYAGAGTGSGDIEWTDSEYKSLDDIDQYGDLTSDQIDEEVRYFKEEEGRRYQEIKEELEAEHTDEETGEVDESALEEAATEKLREELEEGFREQVESGDSLFSEIVKTLKVGDDEFKLEGRPEGEQWWSAEGFSYEGSENEAEIQYILFLKQKGLIETDVDERALSKVEDIEWKESYKYPTYETLDKKVKKLIKDNPEKVIERINQLEDKQYQEQDEKEQQSNLKSHARRIVKEEYRDLDNPRSKVTYSLDHPVVEGYSIKGNNKKGWALYKEDDSIKTLQGDTEAALKDDAIKYLKDELKLFADDKQVSTDRDISKPVASPRFQGYTTDGGENYREILLTLPKVENTFKYPAHFKQENIVAHARLTDRTDLNGRKTLYIEEIQSDWHQQGREKGYISESIDETSEEKKGEIPDAPFKKTEAWAELAIKRMIVMATNEGYDAVAWSPASEQIERWGTDLIEWKKKDDYWLVGAARQKGGQAGGIDIEAEAIRRNEQLEKKGDKVANKEELLNVIKGVLGKDKESRALKSLTESVWKQMQEKDSGEKRPRAEGMKMFYDNLLPKVVKSVLKKVDSEAEMTTSEFDIGKTEIEYTGKEYTEENIDTALVKLHEEAKAKADEHGAYSSEAEDARAHFKYVNRAAMEIKELMVETGSFSAAANKAARVLGYKRDIQNLVDSMDVGNQSKSIFKEKTAPLQANSIPITDKMKETVPKKGFTLFQGDETKRGSISFGGREVNIEILRNADLSTFLHETGHFFLEVMGDLATQDGASQQVVQDYKTLLEWFGVQDRSQITVAHHEKFAEGFERYLAEGYAPSSRLRQAFLTFKEFIISAYKKMINVPGAELTDEVRRVMDRLVASDEEIENVKQKQNQVPLFEDLRGLGFSEADAKKYEESIKNAYDIAKEELTQKLMKDVKKAKSALYKSRRLEVQQEVTDEVNLQREYIAHSILTRGKLPTGEEFGQDVKLSKKAIVEMYGEENLPKTRPYIYRVEGGLSPDLAAELLGFESGDQLLDAMKNLRDKKEVIEEETNTRMEELFPDEYDLSNLKEIAGDTVENKQRGDVLHRELEILVETDFTKFKNVTKKLTRRIPKKEDIAQEAKESIATKRVRDIKPYAYQRAQAKASREAVELLFKGDISGAYEAKLRELYNHELYKEAVNSQKEVEKIVNYMQRFNQRNVRQRLGKAGQQYLEQIDSLMSRFDFRRNVSLISLDKRDSLLKWSREQLNQGHDIDIPEYLLQEANKEHYKNLNLEKLTAIYDTVKNISHLSTLKNKLLKNEAKRDLDEVANEIVTSIKANHNVVIRGQDPSLTLKEKFVKGLKIAAAELTKMEFLFNYLDGNKFNGSAWRNIFKPFADAEDVKTNMVRESVKKMHEIFSIYDRKERASWVLKKTFIPSLNMSMTKANLMALALNQGNQYNKDAVLEGYGWTQGQVDEALQLLDKRDWQTVQNILDHLETFWPLVENMEKKINGLAPAKVEATPIINKHGTFRGGYYPITFDSELSDRQFKLDGKNDVMDIFGGNFARAMTKKGHTIERTSTGGKPIALNLSGLTNHLKNVIHDLAFREAVIDVHKIITHKDVRQAIEGTVGREMYRELNPWLVAIATDRQTPAGSYVENLMGGLKNKATVVSMGLKLSTAYIQILGVMPSMKELGVKNVLDGMYAFFRSPYKNIEFIFERSEFMKTRMDDFDRDVRDYLSRINVTGQGVGAFAYLKAYSADFQINMFKHISIMDMAVAAPTWNAAYKKAMDGQVENIEAGNERDAIAFADTAVRVTQGSGAAKDLAGIQRGSQFLKLFTMFYSYFSVLFNQFVKTHQQYKMDKDIARAVKSLVLLWFMPVVLEELMKGTLPDDDEEKAKKLAGKLVQYPFQSVVLLRDVVNGMDQFGYSPSAAFDAFDSLTKTGKVGFNLLAGDKEEISRTDIKGVVMTTGYFTGLPARQVWLTSEYFYDWLSGNSQPETILEGLGRGLVTGKKRE